MATKSDFIVRSGIQISNNATIANTVYVGGITINSSSISVSGNTINATDYTGTANNAKYLGSVASNYYVNTTGNYILNGAITFGSQGTFFNNAAGSFATFSYNGQPTGDIGAASGTNAGGAGTDFAIASYGGNVIISTNYRQRVTVTSAGLVGIGKTPTTALDVNGTITATGLGIIGDITAYRQAAPTTGAIYLGNAGTRYLYCDGTNYFLPAGKLSVNGKNVAIEDNGTYSLNISGSASTLKRSDGNAMTFNWTGQTGQPSWLWGSNDGINQYVYNPSNFSVYGASQLNQSPSDSRVTLGQPAGIMGAYKSMAMSQDGGATFGSFICKASGGGDGNLAGMTFWNDAYAIKLGIRADGYFGLGGWSRPAWSWYSDPSGNMVAAGDVAAYSDPRLKEDFKVIENPLGILEKLDGGTFKWKEGIKHTAVKAGKMDYGILADQVEAVMPEIVGDSIDIEDVKYKVVAYDKLVPVLIEAIKELKARVEELESSK